MAQLKSKWQADPQFRRAYEALRPEFEGGRRLITARNHAGLSQAEVARRMGTTQSAVARLESGQRLPTISSLQRYANAIGYRVELRLVHTGKQEPISRSAGSCCVKQCSVPNPSTRSTV